MVPLQLIVFVLETEGILIKFTPSIVYILILSLFELILSKRLWFILLSVFISLLFNLCLISFLIGLVAAIIPTNTTFL